MPTEDLRLEESIIQDGSITLIGPVKRANPWIESGYYRLAILGGWGAAKGVLANIYQNICLPQKKVRGAG